MNYKIKCGNCKKVFNFKSDKIENLPEFVFCNFCNKKNKVNIKNKANLVTSIKCRKCSISLDENIIPKLKQRLGKYFVVQPVTNE